MGALAGVGPFGVGSRPSRAHQARPGGSSKGPSMGAWLMASVSSPPPKWVPGGGEGEAPEQARGPRRGPGRARSGRRHLPHRPAGSWLTGARQERRCPDGASWRGCGPARCCSWMEAPARRSRRCLRSVLAPGRFGMMGAPRLGWSLWAHPDSWPRVSCQRVPAAPHDSTR